VRYEHPAPGDLLHLDIKGMTRFQQVVVRGDGKRRGRPQFAGWEALPIAIDDHSRLAFSMILPNQKAKTTRRFLQAAVAFYAQHSIAIRRLLTDNGHSYRSHFFERRARSSESTTASPGPPRRAPTAKRSASSKRPCANGLTPVTIARKDA
jgi:Integrase core domain